MPALVTPAVPLIDPLGRFILRPWHRDDAAALAAAWRDPEIAGWCTVPENASAEAAAHWIAGWQQRLDLGLALDLVVAGCVFDDVLGEVGLRRLARPAAQTGPGVLELGWWVGRDHRGVGVGTGAVGLLAGWAAEVSDEQLVARIPRRHLASARIAGGAGLTLRGPLPSALDLWAYPREPAERAPGAHRHGSSNC